MLDIAFIRNNQDTIRDGMRKKKMTMDLDELLAIDDELRKLRAEVEKFRADRNRISKEISKLKGEDKDRAVAEVKMAKEGLTEKEPKLRDAEIRFEQLMLLVPNPPLPVVPEGESEEDNVEVRRFGSPPEFDFPPKDHLELAEGLDILDMPRAVKFAGGAVYCLKNEGAMLEFALFKFTLDHLLSKGFHPMIVPAACTPRGYDRNRLFSSRGGGHIFHRKRPALFNWNIGSRARLVPHGRDTE